jgi:site-specific recombinase XerD
MTEQEMARLLAALKRKRHGQPDWLIGLLIYRHGLRVSEACDLRWDALASEGNGPSPAATLLGHASIPNTVKYTATSPEPFKDVWR